LWGAEGGTKFASFWTSQNWKKKKLKMHTHSRTHNKASWQYCMSTCGEESLPKFWSFHPSFTVEEFCMILCVFCQSKPPPTHKIYICVFWNNLHHLFSKLHNFTTKTFNVTTIFPAQFRWKNNNNKMLAGLSY
jgi:hypothetical protein